MNKHFNVVYLLADCINLMCNHFVTCQPLVRDNSSKYNSIVCITPREISCIHGVLGISDIVSQLLQKFLDKFKINFL